jgi:hypothetical protein
MENQGSNGMMTMMICVGKIYNVLRFSDSQATGSLVGFMTRMMQARHELSCLFDEGSAEQKKYLDVMDKRVDHLYDDTLMVAGNAKKPCLFSSSWLK